MKIADRTVAEWGRRALACLREGPAPDPQLREFETRDLGADMAAAGTARVIWPRAKATSIVLDAELIAALRRKGATRGLGSQTMLELILREHLDEY